MARPRKTERFKNILSPMTVEDLRQLKSELQSEMKVKEREILRQKSEASAKKVRDKIKIGQKIKFSERAGASGNILAAEVIGIFADKVQVVVGGRRRSISLTRIVDVIRE